ncbi:hypothetical protein MB831_00175 [Pasteurella multocida subsp. multocida]|uniref:Uncharacterized protein n=2 Tax=Pasteurella multocida TaxID=747 RepID=A0A849CIM5_PASMD|nr:hypothetical protein [Pasteurella multocida]AFF23776.1 hypothetical protein PMCN06_0521 [Pasteurella multocida subsp. multocida str. HN06]AWW54408.1 hypothetical protein DID83_07880 [Pasteurella multocida]EPE72135.1 hypothetical protein H364_04438 [Pasteurella multocida 671/90]MCH1906634.1 hypothetical protein [Pasteurella multocida]MCL7770086.1 hypothetical protein [Pasteurella multocida]
MDSAIGGVSSLGFQAVQVMSKNITNIVDARRNMVFLVNSQRAEHILYGDKSGGGDKFGLTRILNQKSKFPIH